MGYDKVNYMLGSTDAAERVLHPRPTWDATFDAVAHASVLHLSFFFFLPQIRADVARFTPNRLQFASNQANSAKIGSYWPTTDMAKTGQKRPKSALKLTGTAEILTSEVFLAFFFLCFVNQGIVMCFLRIF